MKEIDVTDRVEYLAKLFDVINGDEKSILAKEESLKAKEFKFVTIKDGDLKPLAIFSYKQKVSKFDGRVIRVNKKVSVCMDVFASMVAADPTVYKEYLQWMLNLFSRLIKDDTGSGLESAIRLVNEDLPQANDYLKVFNSNKHKKLFSELCSSTYGLSHIKDYSDINQYLTLSQLFDAVDPFIEKNPSELERALKKFVESGQALIPARDRNFTVYIPKTLAASVVFEKFANWCTARSKNGNFASYTSQQRPDGKNSNLYIIIDNKFFNEESKDLYQIHFESHQLKDSRNGSNVNIYERVLSKSEILSSYFKDELMTMAKFKKNVVDKNIYLDYLIEFGFSESLFEILEDDVDSISFRTRTIPKLPDISRFKNLESLVIYKAQLCELHPSIGELTKLELLSCSENKIKRIPKEIGNLKNLVFINLIGNKIVDIPEEIKYLDTSNGGSLDSLAIKLEDIGETNYNRLKELLPNAKML